MTVVYTLGTSTRSLDEFLKLLEKHGIRRIIDVRRFPTSRYEHFKKENLQKIYPRYTHIPELGGYRGGYEGFMGTQEFKEGMKKLLNLVKRGRCVIICAELLYFKCHRRFISDALMEKGVKVIHIIDDKRVVHHRLRANPKTS